MIKSRWVRWGLLSCVGLLAIGWAGLQLYLRSDGARQMASATLQKVLGTPVELDRVGLGLGSVSLHNVRLPQPANESASLVQIGTLSANLGLFDLLSGAQPTVVTLANAQVHLRLNADGDLVSPLPELKPESDGAAAGPLPAIRLVDSRITIEQAGKPTFSVDHVSGDVTSADGRWVGQAAIADATWGAWAAKAEFADNGDGNVWLNTEKSTHIDLAMLQSVPFIPNEVWKEVQIDGNAEAKIEFRIGGTPKKLSYHVDVKPQGTAVSIPAIELKLADTQGDVVIDDAVVSLKGMTGKTASGEIRADGVLNFRDEPNVLKLRVSANGLEVRQLPEAWGLPKNLSGQLKGSTDELTLKLAPGKPMETSGSGVGIIENAMLGKIPVKRAEMRLRSSGRGFRFDSGAPAADSSNASPTSTSPLDPALLSLAVTMLQGPPPPRPQVAPPAPGAKPNAPSYLTLNLALEDVLIPELLKELQLKVPFAINGKLTVTVRADIPTETSDDLKTYRLVGRVSVPDLILENMRVKNLQARVVYRDGAVTLEPLSAEVPVADGGPAGKIRGTASMSLLPAGPLQAKLDIENLPAAQLVGLVPNLGRDAGGTLNGKLSLTAPSDLLSDPTRWTARAEVTAPKLRAAGYNGEGLAIVANLGGGKVTFEKFAGKVEGSPITGKAEVTLDGGFPISATANVGPVDLAKLGDVVPQAKLPVAVAGQLSSTISLNGTLNPLNVQSQGMATLAGPKIDRFTLDDARFSWDVNSARLKITQFATKFLNGDLAGTFDFPFDPKQAGALMLNFKQFDFSYLKKLVPQVEVVGIDGQADGTLGLTIAPVNESGTDRPLVASMKLTEGAIRVRKVPVREVDAKGEYSQGKATFQVQGKAFGGKVAVDGTYPAPPPPKDDSDPQPMGKISLDGLSLTELATFAGGRAGQRLAGSLSATLPYAFTADGSPVGIGSIRLRDVRWGTYPISQQTVATVRLTTKEVRVSNLQAALGEGLLRGTAIVNLTALERSRVILTLLHFPLNRLNALVAEPTKAPLGGHADFHLVTSLGNHITGRGTLSTTRANIYGVPLTDFRMPLTWEYVFSTGRGQVSLRELTGTLASGRISGFGEYSVFPGTGSVAKGEIRFNNVNLPRLTGTGNADLGWVGVGRATGELTLAGNSIRSINDLSGSLRANLSQVEPFQLPIINLVKPFLESTGSSQFTTSNRSEVRAVLRNGLWNVQRLALVGNNIRMFMEGTIALTGKLDLEVLAVVGQNVIPPEILRLGELIATPTGAVPVVVALRVTRYLSDRSLHLVVGGTVQSPQVRLLPLKTLSSEATRFFLDEFAPVPSLTPKP
ncbi:AsmA-like C-terminal region-containing protein [Tuwongella immobilis]|uniref:Uncharacterized protein n=1 Tax=Tuwongella immobilis TaxID=692036 RepID=A0A6C2YSX7_9BACT|nr:AsmA-like C-terminal region-containing protein [Tuwongella immobilis]VIP04820.1 Uncharacterized protein OS=Singulisphaera acidiphila (strain ATCC BAA-1392 / DSM 18658 / VKM B-2454 / MOB10) GN=Sinac_1031 PE=4 SV=1: DUF3971: AsmA_2 [Tuwongella immobilis]VTS07000.1 Uncharacterized protein OS=Singulisphaera acidiphila (strain ATCC BAA-1392 / DSM 18658 / VKM B-2454 / MOB10) GN=Sinac_1031 PE=4 SV=1: DUF3971: AsmA_2 [Tuwongella immobilis]